MHVHTHTHTHTHMSREHYPLGTECLYIGFITSTCTCISGSFPYVPHVQICLPNGKVLRHSLPATALLSEVAEFVTTNKPRLTTLSLVQVHSLLLSFLPLLFKSSLHYPCSQLMSTTFPLNIQTHTYNVHIVLCMMCQVLHLTLFHKDSESV